MLPRSERKSRIGKVCDCCLRTRSIRWYLIDENAEMELCEGCQIELSHECVVKRMVTAWRMILDQAWKGNHGEQTVGGIVCHQSGNARRGRSRQSQSHCCSKYGMGSHEAEWMGGGMKRWPGSKGPGHFFFGTSAIAIICTHYIYFHAPIYLHLLSTCNQFESAHESSIVSI